MLETLRIILALVLTLLFLGAVLVLSWKSIPVYRIGTPETVGDIINTVNDAVNPGLQPKYFWAGVTLISGVGWAVWRHAKRGSNHE